MAKAGKIAEHGQARMTPDGTPPERAKVDGATVAFQGPQGTSVKAVAPIPAVTAPRKLSDEEKYTRLGVGVAESILDVVLAVEGGGAAIAPVNRTIEGTEDAAFSIAYNR